MTHPKKGLAREHRESQKEALNKVLGKYTYACVVPLGDIIQAVEDPEKILEESE